MATEIDHRNEATTLFTGIWPRSICICAFCVSRQELNALWIVRSHSGSSSCVDDCRANKRKCHVSNQCPAHSRTVCADVRVDHFWEVKPKNSHFCSFFSHRTPRDVRAEMAGANPFCQLQRHARQLHRDARGLCRPSLVSCACVFCEEVGFECQRR